jgi:hypothetical protein
MSQDCAARLERRARTLLRAYPADYRRDRAEELIGTLLEATPAGRSFPSARDVQALIAGGVRARAARNRRLSTTANLRLALLLGLSIFLPFDVNGFLSGKEVSYAGFGWLAIAAGSLSVAVALAPWLGRRTVTTAIVLPAAAVLVYQIYSESLGGPPRLQYVNDAFLAGMLVAMGALVALSGGKARLPRSWLWLPCVPLAGLAVGGLLRSPGEGYGFPANYIHELVFTAVDVPDHAILVLAAVVACWFVTDARPTFGLVAAAMLTWLNRDLVTLNLPFVSGSNGDAVLPLAIGLAIMLALTWLLHRQAAPRLRPLPKP